MSERHVRTVLDGLSYLECPRWHDGRVWVSDFYTHAVVAAGADGSGRETVVEVPGQPSGLGWLPDGTLLVVSMKDRRLLRVRDGAVEEHADLSRLAPWHLNDLVVDAEGRAYLGNFGFDLMAGADLAPTSIARVDPGGAAQVVADGLLFPNGMVLTDDGRTLIVAETFGPKLTAFDVEADGSLSGRRDWARLGDPPPSARVEEAVAAARIAPDGITLDAEGCVWFADALGGRAARVREGGKIVDEVGAGGLGVFACALGGPDGRTLFMCAAPSFLEHERRDKREAVLLACEVDVPHAGRP